VPCFAIAPLGLTTEGSTKFKLKGWKCYLKKLQCGTWFISLGNGICLTHLVMYHLLNVRALNKQCARARSFTFPSPLFASDAITSLSNRHAIYGGSREREILPAVDNVSGFVLAKPTATTRHRPKIRIFYSFALSWRCFTNTKETIVQILKTKLRFQTKVPESSASVLDDFSFYRINAHLPCCTR